MAKRRANEKGASSGRVVRARRTSAPSPNIHSQVGSGDRQTERRLQIAHDIGTTSTSTSYRILGSSTQVYDVEYDASTPEPHLSPAIFWYGPDKVLVWGHELLERIAQGLVSPGDVIRQPKLASFPNVGTRTIRRRVKEQLDSSGKTITNLFEDYYAALTEMAKTVASSSLGVSRQKIDDMALDIFSSTPDMFDPECNLPLTSAARNIKAATAYIVSEPVCLATALFLDDVQSWNPKESPIAHETGDIIVFVDLGGGFACFAIVQLLQSPTDTAGFAMKVIAPTINFPCGSSLIDTEFESYLPVCTQVTKEGGVDSLAAQLGYSRRDFIARSVLEFERDCKKTFPKSHKYSIKVDGRAGYRQFWVMALTRDEMEQLYRPVVTNIATTTQEVMKSIPGQETPKAIVLAGGFARNPHVREMFNERWSQQEKIKVLYRGNQIKCANTRGALHRFCNPQILGLNHRFNLAVIRDEVWDADRHPDATSWSTNSGKTRAIPNPDVAVGGLYDGSVDWVHDRLNWIYRKGTAYESWSIHQPQLSGSFQFEQELVCTDRDTVQDGDPAYAKHKLLHPHLKRFRTVTHTIDNPQGLGWKRVTHPSGETTYVVAVCTKVFVSETDIKVGFKVVDEAEVPEDDILQRRENAEISWVGVVKPEVWSARFSQVPLGGDV